METSFWRKCSSCKKPIGFKQAYQRCNVSTCNQVRVSLVFCSVSCWSAHVPVYRHRDSWAIEEISPSLEAWTAQNQNTPQATAPQSSASKAPLLVRSVQGAAPQAATSQIPRDILIVASKLKEYIRKTSDMNTSGEVMDVLSDKVRALCDEAVRRARADGRKTVMERDF